MLLSPSQYTSGTWRAAREWNHSGLVLVVLSDLFHYLYGCTYLYFSCFSIQLIPLLENVFKVVNPGPCLVQTQKCDWFKPVNGIPTLPS